MLYMTRYSCTNCYEFVRVPMVLKLPIATGGLEHAHTGAHHSLP